jgi:hypothetical protein
MSAAITTRRGFLRTSAAFAAGLFSKLSPATAASLMHNHYYKGSITDHFGGLRCFRGGAALRRQLSPFPCESAQIRFHRLPAPQFCRCSSAIVGRSHRHIGDRSPPAADGGGRSIS